MAAFFTSHFPSNTFTPRAVAGRASVFAASGVNRRRTIHPAATAARLAAAAGEILFFFWTLAVLAFAFLVIAGFLE
jgi:hypothetical protein